MQHNSLSKKSLFSQVRLTRVAVFSAILLAFLLALNGVSSAFAIDAPQLISPAYGTETTGNPSDPDTSRVLHEPLGLPTFEWQDLGASKYQLEVATTAAFGDSVILRISNLQYTTFTPSGTGETGTGFSLTEESGEFTDSAFAWFGCLS